MSCGWIALDIAKIKVEKYYASEIDKYAQIVSEKNYPDIIRLGDITKWQDWKIGKPDIIIAGSPCQGFSFAGKGLNFEDPRSKLFFTFVDILNHYKPKYFLLENVKMKKEYQDVISKAVGVEPIGINSALVSAQNRKRLYWTNIPNVTQPKDKGILLKDIIESGMVNKGITDTYINYIINKKGEPEKGLNRKSKCFTAGAHSGGTHSDMDLIPVYTRPHGYCKESITEKDKYPTVSKDPNSKHLILAGMANISGHDIIKRVYSSEGKAPTLTKIQGGNQEPKIAIDFYHWRKLTPLECERLQTIPDNYTNHVSNSQRYKMLGNGWTVSVIAHIFKGLK